MSTSKLVSGIWSIGLIAIILGACNRFKQGERLYNNHCASCHMADGTGLNLLIPSLEESKLLLTNPAALACIIRWGIAGDTTDLLLLEMPPNQALSAVELSNVINYIKTEWGNNLADVSPGEVEKRLEECE